MGVFGYNLRCHNDKEETTELVSRIKQHKEMVNVNRWLDDGGEQGVKRQEVLYGEMRKCLYPKLLKLKCNNS